MGNDIRTDLWVDRMRTLGGMLARRGRTDLTQVVSALEKALMDAAGSDELRAPTLELVAEAIDDLRACVLDEDREPSGAISASLAQLNERSCPRAERLAFEVHDEATARSTVMLPPRRSSYPEGSLAGGTSLAALAVSLDSAPREPAIDAQYCESSASPTTPNGPPPAAPATLPAEPPQTDEAAQWRARTSHGFPPGDPTPGDGDTEAESRADSRWLRRPSERSVVATIDERSDEASVIDLAAFRRAPSYPRNDIAANRRKRIESPHERAR